MSNVIFSMSEGQAEHFPDWESRELTVECRGRIFLVFDFLQDEDSTVLAHFDGDFWTARADGRQYSDVAIRVNETLTPGDGPPIGSSPTAGNDPLLALHRLLRPELYGYQADPRDWTAEVMSDVNEAVEQALHANGNPHARLASRAAEPPRAPSRPKDAVANLPADQLSTITDSLRIRALDRQADEYGDGGADAAADLYRELTGQDPALPASVDPDGHSGT